MGKEYPVLLGMKIFYGVLAIVMFVFSIYLFNIYNPARVASAVLLFPVFIILGSVCILINIFKRKVIVYDDRIVSIGLFSTKELFIESIKGVRVESKVIYVEPINLADRQLRIGNYYDLKNSNEFVKWLQDNFTDLNSIDLADEQTRILHNSELGATEVERGQTLKKSKKIALTYNICGVVACIFILIFSNTIKAATVSILYPLVGIIVIVSSHGLIKFASNPKRSVYPSVLLGFVLPSFFSPVNFTRYIYYL